MQVKNGETVIAEYAYDGFGRRVKKTVASEITHYHYDLSGLLISETDGSGNAIRDYVYLNGEPVAMQLYGDDAGWYYFVNDHLGTPQKVVDSAGTVVWEAGYLPFGEARLLVADIENNLRFPGQYFDGETGLHYNWHRYYDPEMGRYLTPDPIGLDGGINLYCYVGNNSTNATDEYGLFSTLFGTNRNIKPNSIYDPYTTDEGEIKVGPFLVGEVGLESPLINEEIIADAVLAATGVGVAAIGAKSIIKEGCEKAAKKAGGKWLSLPDAGVAKASDIKKVAGDAFDNAIKGASKQAHSGQGHKRLQAQAKALEDFVKKNKKDILPEYQVPIKREAKRLRDKARADRHK